MASKQHSIAEARSNLPGLVREAESGRAVELTRRGQPVAVLVGRREYERLVSGTRGFAAAYEAFSRNHDLRDLNVDPDEIFAGARDGSRARDVEL